MSLKANLKRFFLSPWFYILFVPVLALSVLIYLTSGGSVSDYVYHLPIINVYLTVFVTVFSVYAAHSIKEIEWSVKSRVSVIAKEIAAANIFCLSAVLVPVIFIVFGCIQKGLPFELAMNYIFYILCLTLAQTVFLCALGFLLGSVIKVKAAYPCAVLLSAVFTPFFQNYLVHSNNDPDLSASLALTNLINISWDDTSKINYAGYGMPFNSETILSWIITLLVGIILILAVLAVKRCFKLKGAAALCVLSAAVIVSGVYCVKLYFEASPIIYVFNYIRYVDEYVDEPPIKPDTAHIYSDPDSPVISRYEMKLDTGNTVKNECELELNVNNNSSVKLRLDECFEIHSLTVNGESSDYEREGNYFTVSLDPLEDVAVIALEYSGRMNYTDNLHNKTDVCDYTGGFLSEMFSWYPKLLSTQNFEQPKSFTIEINAVNRFVSNLDGYALHPSGKQKISGEEKDILFYLGFISEINYSESGLKVILPTEYEKNSEAVNYILNMMTYDNSKNYKNYFAKAKTLSLNDFKKTETTLISYEELQVFVNEQLDNAGVDAKQRDTVVSLLSGLKDIWDNSLIEKAENPEYIASDEVVTVNNLFLAIYDAENYTSADEKTDTIVVIPYSYNLAFDSYAFENCLIVAEGNIA